MIYAFGPFRVDSRERVLWRHQERVPLTPKVFDILLALVQNSGHILTKDQLMKLVWPGATVEESNLARNVSSLRKGLGDRANDRPYIETIPWRGYRFAAVVSEVREQPAAIDSLAVLPLLNESADPATEYLSDGITESLINKLSRMTNLKVMSRSSVFRYKVRESKAGVPDAGAAGREMGVRAVLTGRVKLADGILIVSVELVDTFDSRHLWGAQYNRELSGIFAMQEAISQQIAERLRVRLTGNEEQSLRKPDTENAEAYHLYLKGRFFLNKFTIDGVRTGIELFQHAIEKDPGYALAYTGLLDCYTYLNNPTQARKAALKALELDPSLGEAHASLGFFTFLYDWDWPEAERRFQQAIELNPSYAQAHHWYAIYLANMGRRQDALREAQLAQQLDPLSLPMNQTAGLVLCLAREYDRAIDELRKVIDMDANFAAAHSTLGVVYAHKGLCEQAILEFQKVIALAGGHPAVDASLRAFIAYAYAASGRPEMARKLLADISSQSGASSYVLATIYARLGENDRAFECLDRAYRERDMQIVCMKVDPALDPLRCDARFQDLVARLRLPP